MKILIRKPDLTRLTEEGIPEDFARVRDYFNRALEQNKYPFVARRTPITTKEIRELWVPSARTNINLIAQQNRRVVGSLTVFYKPDSTEYEYKNQREAGDIGETADPDFNGIAVKRNLVDALILVLRDKNLQARFMAPAEDPFLAILEKMGYGAKESEGVQRYKNIGLSGKSKEYILP